MNIYKMVGRNLDITDAMRSYAEGKLARLTRFSGQIIDAKVVMSYKQGLTEPATVEVQLNVPNGIIRAEEKGVDSYAAVDRVVDKLERQVKRYTGRMIARRTEEAPSLVEPEETERLPEIVRVKRHVLRPMSAEDAAIQMEALGHTFFMFHNVDTGDVNVIYVRHDGDYGLLQPGG
jgi:putative sigma-54 modulation protein